MTDIATRYMRLVEKRPELAATLKGSPIGVRVDDFGTPWWTVDDNGWTIETENGDEQMHALVFKRLVEALPDSASLSHSDGISFMYRPKDGGFYAARSDIEAVLAFWEGKL